jgi:hypothetical protein
MTETAVVTRVSSTVEAQLIAGMLKANEISAIVSTDDAGGTEPQLQISDGVRVLVPTHDLARARALVDESNS